MEELRWLSTCITVGVRETSKISAISGSSLSPSDSMKRKRDTAFPSPRPRDNRRACSDSTAPRFHVAHDLTDSESEKRDVITPLRFQRTPEPQSSTTGDITKAQIDDAREAQTFVSSLESATDSVRVRARRNSRRATTPLPKVSSEVMPVPEIIQTSSSLPTSSSLSTRRRTGYFPIESETTPSDSSIRSRRKPRSLRSVDLQTGPPLWTSMLRPKSKAQRSVPSLKAQPSQSLSLKDTPPISFLKGSPISWSTKEPSLDTSESSDSSQSSGPSTPPLTAPRFPAAEEDVFGRSSPTWLPDDEAPVVVCRSLPTVSAMKTPPRRKDSSASTATGSGCSGIIMDGSLTPTGSNKSVKFAERPTFHYPSTLYWDRDLEEGHTFVSPDMGVDVDGMDLEEIPEIESPTLDSQIDSDNGISLGSSNIPPPPPPKAPMRSPSPARSVTPSMRSTSSHRRFHLFSSGKSKEPATTSIKDNISGPFALAPTPPNTVRSQQPASRPGTPSSLRSVRTTSRPGTPVFASRPSTPSHSQSTPIQVPDSPRRPRRLVKPPSFSSTKSSDRGRKPLLSSSSIPPVPPVPLVHSSNVFGRSSESLHADAKSVKSTRSEKTRGRKWWTVFGGSHEKRAPSVS
ncbi:hypothetical protein DL96DRAFT_1728612 [Flagelloscypha sp. PMI_526]|nr:hypothetical protein DL96DRAFT_1728612 [Flagelloscypha sp. PMI_526]